MLHPQLLAELLDDEVGVAVERLGGRATNLHHDGRYVRCALPAPDGSTVWLTLDAIAYDGQPVGVDVRDDAGQRVGIERWSTGLAHSIHPVHQRPWVCTRGTAEYFTYPGHHADRWDAVRVSTRVPDLLDHLLRKAGRP